MFVLIGNFTSWGTASVLHERAPATRTTPEMPAMIPVRLMGHPLSGRNHRPRQRLRLKLRLGTGHPVSFGQSGHDILCRLAVAVKGRTASFVLARCRIGARGRRRAGCDI